MTTASIGRLQFYFSEFDQEIEAISNIASEFIDKKSTYILPRLRGVLEDLRAADSSRTRLLEIPVSQPLKTRVSSGCYEVGGGGSHNVYAEVDFIWEIQPLGNNNRGSRPHRRFAVAGIASTRVRLMEDSNHGPLELAMWRVEIADQTSPGCCFHVQVLGQNDQHPFPKSLPIPRLPGLLVTPPLVIEYVLGELFQDEWVKQFSRSSPGLNRWRPIQQQRLTKMLAWQSKVLNQASASPWVALKKTFPPDNLFV